ncbi:MAG: hypothetical protein LBQ22_11250 [Bacteroidales bacterium]|jgi:hypothetical protein|nr:hypothetical protein [Bacteroidales bacterium]
MEHNTGKKLTKQQVEILKKLYDNKEEEILSGVKILRENGGDFSIVPLMEIYFNTPYPEVRNTIGYLFSDIKDNKLENIISGNILKYLNNQYLNIFLSKLWQSTLKFSDLSVFVELFIKGDDKTALEAITIIEQSSADARNEDKKNAIELLNQNMEKLDNEFKRHLAVDLLNYLNN